MPDLLPILCWIAYCFANAFAWLLFILVWVAAVGFLLFCQNQRPINETGSNRDSVPNTNHDINYCIAQSALVRSYDLLSRIVFRKLKSNISTKMIITLITNVVFQFAPVIVDWWFGGSSRSKWETINILDFLQ
jgi:hypothetical protein